MTIRTIDLRSDTVTLPSPQMRRAIAEADLGDDVYGEDPTVNRLEALVAERLGKAAALLVPSGTMGNLCAILAHCGRGDEVIVGDESHIYHYEAGGASVLGAVAYHPVATTPQGELPLPALAEAVRNKADSHQALTRLICLENTHNRCGGVVLTLEYLRSVATFARQHGLHTHMDGARLFNAAVALGIAPQQLTQHVDSVQICLSKGLAAPVGSLLAGEPELIQRARRIRKLLGGGMRQAGIIAAAGIIALDHMIERLAQDHTNARLLAEGLSRFSAITIDLQSVQTNIVRFRIADQAGWTPDRLLRVVAQRGLLLGGIGHGYIRAVTHYGIDQGDIEEALEILEQVLCEE